MHIHFPHEDENAGHTLCSFQWATWCSLEQYSTLLQREHFLWSAPTSPQSEQLSSMLTSVMIAAKMTRSENRIPSREWGDQEGCDIMTNEGLPRRASVCLEHRSFGKRK